MTRRLALSCGVLLFLVTVFCFSYNAVTQGRVAPPSGLSYVQSGDVLTRYREWGSAGRPIVLVHGFMESADMWGEVAPLLGATGYHVLALDLDGFGFTQRIAPYDVDHLTTQLLDFIWAMHLSRPILVGHSSGAAIVASATLRAPSAVGGIMFLDGDALASGAGAHSGSTAFLVQPYRTTLLRLVVRSDWVIRTLYRRACGPTCPALDAAGIQRWRRPLQVRGAEAALWAMAQIGVLGLPADRLAALAALPIPKAVVFGADDATFSKGTPAQTAHRIGAFPPTIIPGARHLTPINSPQAVAAAIDALARRAPGPG